MTSDWGLVVALAGVAIGMLTLAAAHIYTTPKEMHGHLASRVSAGETRASTIESAVAALALRFEGSHARHDEAIDNLTDAVKGLTTEIRELQRQMARGPTHDRRRTQE